MRAAERNPTGGCGKVNDDVASADSLAALLCQSKVTAPGPGNDHAFVSDSSPLQGPYDSRPDEPRSTSHQHPRAAPEPVCCPLLTVSFQSRLYSCRSRSSLSVRTVHEGSERT